MQICCKTPHAIALTAILLAGMVAPVKLSGSIKARHSAITARQRPHGRFNARLHVQRLRKPEPTVARKGPVTVIDVVDRAIKAASNDSARDLRARAELLHGWANTGTQGDLRSGILPRTRMSRLPRRLAKTTPLSGTSRDCKPPIKWARRILRGGQNHRWLIARLPAMPIELQSKVLLDSAAIARRTEFERALSDGRKAALRHVSQEIPICY
jgi:hypothetical protein